MFYPYLHDILAEALVGTEDMDRTDFDKALAVDSGLHNAAEHIPVVSTAAVGRAADVLEPFEVLSLLVEGFADSVAAFEMEVHEDGVPGAREGQDLEFVTMVVGWEEHEIEVENALAKDLTVLARVGLADRLVVKHAEAARKSAVNGNNRR